MATAAPAIQWWDKLGTDINEQLCILIWINETEYETGYEQTTCCSFYFDAPGDSIEVSF